MQRLVSALEEGQQLGIVVEGDCVSMAVCLLAMLKEYWFQSLLGAPPRSLEVFLPEVYRMLQGGMLRKFDIPCDDLKLIRQETKLPFNFMTIGRVR